MSLQRNRGSNSSFANGGSDFFARERPKASSRYLLSKRPEFVHCLPKLRQTGPAFRDDPRNRLLVACNDNFLAA
jgi:hypothetical protein